MWGETRGELVQPLAEPSGLQRAGGVLDGLGGFDGTVEVALVGEHGGVRVCQVNGVTRKRSLFRSVKYRSSDT